jgi:hypothetical protein
MNENTTAMTTMAAPKPPIVAGERGLQLRTIDDYWRMANYVAESGLAPKGIDKPAAILVAMQHGAELGMSPLASLQNIAVINGRPGLYGDAQLAIVRAHPDHERVTEWFEMDGKRLSGPPATNIPDQFTAVCYIKRRGEEPVTSTFSVADAKRAQLWGKAGPWLQYPARMLRFRARSFGLRDTFGDALKGLRTVEDLASGAIDVETVATPAPVTPSVFVPTVAAVEAPVAAAEPTTPPRTPQDEAKEIVEGGGYTLAQFSEWAIEAGHLEQINEPKEWAQLPTDVAHRVKRGKGQLLKALGTMFALPGGAQ